MSRRTPHFFALIGLVMTLLTSTSAGAVGEAFTVVLKSGQTFDTRYRPVTAEWDENISMLLTDRGNWIALHNDEIVDVTSMVEESGFGVRIDAATLMVGWGYNEGGEEGEDGDADGGAGGTAVAGGAASGGGGVDGAGIGGSGGTSPGGGGSIGAANGLPADVGGFTIEQFVNTDAAGDSGGIPADSVVNQ